MLFNSYIFIFLFLPVVLIGYYGLNHFQYYRISNIFLMGMSIWFYGYFNPKYIPVICVSILANYILSRGMTNWGGESKTYYLYSESV